MIESTLEDHHCYDACEFWHVEVFGVPIVPSSTAMPRSGKDDTNDGRQSMPNTSASMQIVRDTLWQCRIMDAMKLVGLCIPSTYV